MAIGEHFSDGNVRLKQGFIAGLPPEHDELARPGEFSVIGINFEFCWRRTDVWQLLQPGVMPILIRAEIESGSGQLIAFRIIGLELFARADGTVVPVVDSVAIEI